MSLKVKNRDDLNYIQNYHAAVHMKEEKFSRAIIWGFFFFLILLIIWIYFAKIDKMTRGVGKVVPSLELQYIQSYDGGIIQEIFVHDGAIVHIGDSIMRIDDADFKSKFYGGEADINALLAQKHRLEAESKGIPFSVEESNDTKLYKKLLSEKKLYDARQTTLNKKVSIIKEKVVQKKAEFSTITIELENLEKERVLAEEMLTISERMFTHKVLSKMQYNVKIREYNTIEGQLKEKKSLIPKINSEIQSSSGEISHAKLKFQSEARAELEKVTAQLDKLQEAGKIDKGRIHRALIHSPINGTIKKMHYNTVGGVVKPGGVIAEVVPTEEHLIIDTKIIPSKIAFIYTTQRAVVRFSAYDFAIYGALSGEVISISADTTIDELDKKHYYTVKIKTDRNYLEKEGKKLPIKIGMVATVDIMNGKQSIMDYILSPIIKAKQNMLGDH